MKRRMLKWAVLLSALMLLMGAMAQAQGSIDTTVVMRVSHMTQSAVVDAGEDLSIDVNITGVNPDSYQWYFEGTPIPGATQKVLNIVNAQPEDSGIYRLDAFDESGKLVVSMDISARVVDKSVPQSGDGSMPVGIAFAGVALCAVALALLLRRRAAL